MEEEARQALADLAKQPLSEAKAGFTCAGVHGRSLLGNAQPSRSSRLDPMSLPNMVTIASLHAAIDPRQPLCVCKHFS
jgi:hypothetical protein